VNADENRTRNLPITRPTSYPLIQQASTEACWPRHHAVRKIETELRTEQSSQLRCPYVLWIYNVMCTLIAHYS